MKYMYCSKIAPLFLTATQIFRNQIAVKTAKINGKYKTDKMLIEIILIIQNKWTNVCDYSEK